MSKPIINADECSACGACADSCPSGVLEVDDIAKVVNEDECTACGTCQDECPMEAIQVEE